MNYKKDNRYKGPRTNQYIRANEVRVIDDEGEMLGVMHPKEALKKAQEAGLDLVEISPNANPPVCKIMDYGKYLYQQKKKENEAKKKQVVVHLKEIKLRPTTEKHDYETKMKRVRKFLEDGDKVKFSIRFKGREITHKELGFQLLNQIKEELGEDIKIELEPRSEGRQLIMIVSPAK